jgi:molybdopterin/thiamine biosynthesis adenylyltransferase
MVDGASQRYLRQANTFPELRRQKSALAIFGADTSYFAGMSVLAGTAAMGIPVVSSDYHGPESSSHWLTGSFPDMVQKINPDVNYGYLDPDVPAIDLNNLVEGYKNSWAVVLLNDTAYAKHVLTALASANLNMRMILALDTANGILIERCVSPSAALEQVVRLSAKLIPAGPSEFGIISAGLILNEIMQASEAYDELDFQRTIAFYGLNRPRRVRTEDESFHDLFAEVSSDPDEPAASFTDKSFVMVGAGALANWCVIPLALDSPRELLIFDGDPAVDPHNLNRQILLVNGIGKQQPKVNVLVAELQSLDLHGKYEGVAKFIETPEDLLPLGKKVDAMICVPDNNKARFTCDDVRRRCDVIFATAGSSPTGGQAIVRKPGQACLHCLGLNEDPEQEKVGSQSCALTENEAVVSSNMVAAGLIISELRQALAGRATTNIRFLGDSRTGNRLARMVSNPKCPHIANDRLCVVQKEL